MADVLPAMPLPAARAARRAEARVAWALTAPALLLMLLLLLAPTAAVFVLSFTDYELGASAIAFVGLDNYTNRLKW